MNVVLVMFRDNGERRSFSLTRDVTVIGRREDADFRIPLTDVSRKHCRLIKDGNALLLEDLGSSNGTYHNGTRVQEAEIRPGDTLRIGPVQFMVQIDGVPGDQEMSESALQGGSDVASTDSAATMVSPSIGMPPRFDRPEQDQKTIDEPADEFALRAAGHANEPREEADDLNAFALEEIPEDGESIVPAVPSADAEVVAESTFGTRADEEAITELEEVTSDAEGDSPSDRMPEPPEELSLNDIDADADAMPGASNPLASAAGAPPFDHSTTPIDDDPFAIMQDVDEQPEAADDLIIDFNLDDDEPMSR